MKNLIYIAALMAIITSCNNKENTPEETAEIATTVVQEDKTVVPVNKAIECFGTIDVPPFAVHEVFSKASGYISKLTILEGQQVKKGEVIAEIESPEFARLQKEYQSAKATYEWQKLQFERNRKLYENKAISDKDYQLIEKDYQVAKSHYVGLKEEVKAIGFNPQKFIDATNTTLQIRSKTNGTVVSVGIKNGSKVSPDTHLFTILDQSHLHVEMKVSGNDISKVRTEQAFYLVNNEDTIRGTVHLINKLIEDDNTVKVHGHFDQVSDEEKLIVGQKVFVNIVP